MKLLRLFLLLPLGGCHLAIHLPAQHNHVHHHQNSTLETISTESVEPGELDSEETDGGLIVELPL